MDTVTSARALMGISLAFHIIYAALGIGLPLLFLIAEGLSLWKKNDVYHQIARRWTRQAALVFAIGAVSGTVLSFELGFLWPRFMGFAGPMIGLAFSMEGFAFFTEAIFLGLYLYGADRLSRRAQFWVTVPVAVAAAASGVLVISANGWMNTPVGFEQSAAGAVTNVFPWQAFANPAWPHEAVHGTMASYVATGFVVAGIYAWALIRRRSTDYNRRALSLALAVALVAVPGMILTGDWSARTVAQLELPKFAAMEGVFKTVQGAPVTIGGWPDPNTQTVRYGIEIPGLLSWLGYGDPNATVKGLNDFPAGTTPDPRLVHLPFDVMVGGAFLMLGALALYWLVRWISRRTPTNRFILWIVLLASPFGFLALEMGWFVTEFGRQPWAAVDYMKVSQAVTPQLGITLVLLAFLAVYFALTAGLLLLLLRPGQARTGNPPAQEAKNGSA